MDRRRVTAEDIAEVPELTRWWVDGERLRTELHLSTYAAAGRFVAEICELADAHDHHPDLAVRYPGIVTVEMSSHDVGHLTPRDVTLATEIEGRAQAVGATRAEPED